MILPESSLINENENASRLEPEMENSGILTKALFDRLFANFRSSLAPKLWKVLSKGILNNAFNFLQFEDIIMIQ